MYDNNRVIGYQKQCACLTELKAKEETKWLFETNSQALQAALRNLDTAYQNFRAGRAEKPTFKSKRKKNSFRVPQHVKVADDKILFPKFRDGIRMIRHREIKGVVRHCTISKTSTGKFFVSILCEVEHEPLKPVNRQVGLDLGIKDFVVTSDGIRFKNNHYLKKYEKKLAKAQRHLSRKKPGSNGRRRQRLKVSAIHEKIANTRHDLLHKISTRITNEYDTICVEDLNVKGMMKNRKLAKHIGDVSWGTFLRYLEYKCSWNERRLVKINRFYPSSKTCNQCGYINHELKLSERTWICPSGHIIDRDINASKNILEQGLKLIGAELSDHTDGGLDKTSARKHKPMKSEAHKSSAYGAVHSTG